MKARHPTKDFDIYCEVEPRTNKTRPARQVVVQDREGKYPAILITDDIKDPDDLKAKLIEMGIKEAKFEECWAHAEEQGLMRKLCSLFEGRINWDRMSPYSDTGERQHVVSFFLTRKYFQAVAKIAFHYCLKQFSHLTGIEAEFDGIRSFIMSGGKEHNWVQQKRGSFVYGLNKGMTTDKFCHLIGVEIKPELIPARLQFFVGPRGKFPYYEVSIGGNPGKIITHQRVGHQFVYFDGKDRNGFVGSMDPMITRKLALPWEFNVLEM